MMLLEFFCFCPKQDEKQGFRTNLVGWRDWEPKAQEDPDGLSDWRAGKRESFVPNLEDSSGLGRKPEVGRWELEKMPGTRKKRLSARWQKRSTRWFWTDQLLWIVFYRRVNWMKAFRVIFINRNLWYREEMWKPYVRQLLEEFVLQPERVLLLF